MSQRNFRDLLEARWAENKFVCVGLDSETDKIPPCLSSPSALNTIVKFNVAIIEATKDLVCAYKPNIAFYEKHMAEGMEALRTTIGYINQVAPNVPVILDFKRGDIGSTNCGYVELAFGQCKADAVTVGPYLGAEAMKPFWVCKDKGIFVLCRTSNPGAGMFQDLQVEGKPLYQVVAKEVASTWNQNGNCGVVVGATYPAELAQVRSIVGWMPILIPGIGAQGGDVEKTVNAGKNTSGNGMIINSSRGIIFASNGNDFAEAARRETQKLDDLVTQFL